VVVTLPEFSRNFSAMGRDLRRRVKEFLPRNMGRTTRLAQQVVQVHVYDVYSPRSYERTYNFRKSVRAHLPDENNTKVMFIDSDPTIAKAKLVPGGYGPFIAGEGPGIGFLASTVPSEFPRHFPEAIYLAVKSDLERRFETEVVDKALAKL
jgi:hypothetical protein